MPLTLSGSAILPRVGPAPEPQHWQEGMSFSEFKGEDQARFNAVNPGLKREDRLSRLQALSGATTLRV